LGVLPVFVNLLFICSMLFNSAEYLLLFLPLCLLLHYYIRSQTGKMISLLLLSIYFYMVAYPAYILILFALILVDYGAAWLMDKQEGNHRTFWLLVSLSSNVLLLASFKYYNFFAGNLEGFGLSLPKHSWLLPVGLSFHTFQSMSYTIEVYKKSYPCEKNLLRYALYVLFFPQMVAGPIERPQNILPQFHAFPGFSWDNMKQGFYLLARGLFMKVAVADRLTLLVDPVFKAPENAGPLQCFLAVLFFGIQIYADFSGYSNMALGAARLLGIDLMVNFKQPYLADSLGEFWRRWHISLSTWFRDYIYIPLGGNREGRFNTLRNLFTIFILSGLWHGAGWNFLLWGFLHGMGVGAETLFLRKGTPGIPLAFRILRTQVWVFFCWIFFRASSIENGFDVVAGIFHFNEVLTKKPIPFSMQENIYGLLLFVGVFISERWRVPEKIFAKTGWIFILFLLALSYFLGNFNATTFIYFQF